MRVTERQIDGWLGERENERLELKEAKRRFDFEKLVKYCAALANEGGGSIILGVTDKRPRRVVGTQAFRNLERTKAGLTERLHLRIDAEEVEHRDGRVVVFTAPSRPLGMPISVEGSYWMRAGENLVPMTLDQLRRILEEAGPDFSAEICAGATLEDLDGTAVELLRRLWQRKAPDQDIATRSPERLLADTELLVGGHLTYAALILLGTLRPWATSLGRRRSSSSTDRARSRGQQLIAASSVAVFSLFSTRSGRRSTCATTCSISSKGCSCGTSPPSTNARCARPFSTR